MNPELVLVMPGTWLQVPLHDRRRVAELVSLVERHGHPGQADWLRRQLDGAAEHGGDQVFLRQEADRPAVVLVAWPPSDPVRSLDELTRLAGDGAVPLPHERGYPLLRRGHDGPGQTTTAAAAYWCAHPDSGRVLLLEVTAAVPDSDGDALAVYDLLASDLHWHEDPVDDPAEGAAT